MWIVEGDFVSVEECFVYVLVLVWCCSLVCSCIRFGVMIGMNVDLC